MGCVETREAESKGFEADENSLRSENRMEGKIKRITDLADVHGSCGGASTRRIHGHRGNDIPAVLLRRFGSLPQSRDRRDSPRRVSIVRAFDTYTEVSQSLEGVKLIGRCDKFPCDTGKNFRPKPDKPNYPANGIIKWGPNGGIEIYGIKGRVFCFTGFHLPETPDTINDAGAALADLHSRLTTVSPLVRCLAYVAKMPPAVSGNDGHGARPLQLRAKPSDST